MIRFMDHLHLINMFFSGKLTWEKLRIAKSYGTMDTRLKRHSC